jgi:hypothetical protein
MSLISFDELRHSRAINPVNKRGTKTGHGNATRAPLRKVLCMGYLRILTPIAALEANYKSILCSL